MIKPFGDRVLIKMLDEVKDVPAAGGAGGGHVVVPKSAQGDGKARGQVVATTIGKESPFVVGDKIIFNGQYDEVKDGEDTYYLIEEKNIFGIYE